MAAIDEKTLEKIARSSRPGVLLRQALRSLKRRARPVATPARYQRPLPIIQPGPERGRLLEWDMVKCRLGATLLAKRCVDMAAATYPSGKRKGRPINLCCVGCELGASYRSRLIGYEPPPASQAPEVMAPEQRAARDQYLRETPGSDDTELGGSSPLAEAARLTPDDHDEWR